MVILCTMLTMEELGSSLPDPNKQTFPVLSPHPATGVIYEVSLPVDNDANHGGGGGQDYHPSATVPGTSAIELPQIYDQSNGGVDDVSNANKDALKPSLPNVASKQKGMTRDGGSRSMQQAIDKARVLQSHHELVPSLSLPMDINITSVKKSKKGVKDFDFEDFGKDDLTDRIHAPHPLPYQTRNFRSSVQMKTVPLNKRHRDLFAGLSQHKTLPAPLMKSRILPVHTRPFLWGQDTGATNSDVNTQSPISLPDKFRAEEQHVKKMRGYKRRYSVPQHRKGFHDLHIGGQVTKLGLRDDYRGEMVNLRNTVVPSDIQELYTGKGFKLPASHSSSSKLKAWQENLQAEYELPNSAPATIEIPLEGALQSDSDSNTARSYSADDAANMDTTQTMQQSSPKFYSKPSNRGDHLVKGQGLGQGSKKDRGDMRRNGQGKTEEKKGRRRIPKPKPAHKKVEKSGATLPQLRMESPTRDKNKDMTDTEMIDESTNNDRIEDPSVEITVDSPDVIAADDEDHNADERQVDYYNNGRIEPESSVEITVDTPEVIITDEEDEREDERPVTSGRPESEMDIEMTPEDRDHSASRLLVPFSPNTPKAASPNPLKAADLTLDISEERREELAGVFKKIDADKDGHISIAELQRTLPDTLTTGQQKFIKEVYELVSASTFFGLDEFVTVTCLCEEMLELPEQLKAAYDEVDPSMIEQLISQYVILFSTVDRQQTGSISIEALQEILTMALDKDLKIHTQLYQIILQTIDKEYSSAISKVQYLTFLPYFFTCK